MPKPKLTLVTCLTVAALALSGCGDDSPETSESPETTASTTDAGIVTPSQAPTEDSTPTPAAPELTVTVGELVDGNERTTALLERYTAFENAFWASLAAGEVSAELRSLTDPAALVGIEQAITTQPHPLGGSVTVSPILGDATIADIGFGPAVTAATITGCSDQSQLQYDGGVTGATTTILADIALADDGYVVVNYALGPDAC